MPKARGSTSATYSDLPTLRQKSVSASAVTSDKSTRQYPHETLILCRRPLRNRTKSITRPHTRFSSLSLPLSLSLTHSLSLASEPLRAKKTTARAQFFFSSVREPSSLTGLKITSRSARFNFGGRDWR